jgi:hypothetical protein
MHESEVPVTDRELTAYHEAGHFVASYALLPDQFRDISIIPRSGSAGRCERPEPWGDRIAAKRCAKEAIILLAGYVAEVRRDPRCAARAIITAASDFESAAFYIDGARLSKDTLLKRTRALFVVHWPKVEIVAAAALDWGTDGAGACDVLCELIDNPDGFDDAVNMLRLMGKLPHDREPPEWLARLDPGRASQSAADRESRRGA